MEEKKKVEVEFDKIVKVSEGTVPILCGLGLAVIVLFTFVGFVIHLASKSGSGYATPQDLGLAVLTITLGVIGGLLAYHSADNETREKRNGKIMSWSSIVLLPAGLLVSVLLLETALPLLMFVLSVLVAILMSHGSWMEEIHKEIKDQEP